MHTAYTLPSAEATQSLSQLEELLEKAHVTFSNIMFIIKLTRKSMSAYTMAFICSPLYILYAIFAEKNVKKRRIKKFIFSKYLLPKQKNCGIMSKAHLDLFGGVNVLELILTIVHVVLAVVLIAIVLFQSGSQEGLSGSIAGGAETFFGKNKARSLDGILAKGTAVVAVLFIITSLVLFFITK